MNDTPLTYLKREEIDIRKWDACIEAHANGLIYSRSSYLDTMAMNWEAIVSGDYSAVLALPLRRKWGIAYYFRPAFVQQLGIVGAILPQQYADLMKLVYKRADYGDLFFNYADTGLAQTLGARPMTNMIIDLSEGYDKISARYRADARNSVKKAFHDRLVVMSPADFREVIKLFNQHQGAHIDSVSPADLQRFTELCSAFSDQKMLLIRKVTDQAGLFLSVALLLRDSRRLYNILNITTAAGRQRFANYFLYDTLIREFSGQRLILDMEGSEIESIRLFYGKFGCHLQHYYFHHFNRLPWPIRLLKN